jgi:hypothetical protein
MLLGTILPIIANGYQKLLKMVDDETDAAIAAGLTKTFRFHDYGGLCSKQQMALAESFTCVEKEMFFNEIEMPPQQWRTTVRSLLRVDIYGHGMYSRSMFQSSCAVRTLPRNSGNAIHTLIRFSLQKYSTKFIYRTTRFQAQRLEGSGFRDGAATESSS